MFWELYRSPLFQRIVSIFSIVLYEAVIGKKCITFILLSVYSQEACHFLLRSPFYGPYFATMNPVIDF